MKNTREKNVLSADVCLQVELHDSIFFLHYFSNNLLRCKMHRAQHWTVLKLCFVVHCGVLLHLTEGTSSLLDYLMDNEPCQTIIRLAF